jgi:hypothetical protein
LKQRLLEDGCNTRVAKNSFVVLGVWSGQTSAPQKLSDSISRSLAGLANSVNFRLPNSGIC